MKNTSITTTTITENMTGMSDEYRRGFYDGLDAAAEILRTVREMKQQEGSADDDHTEH